MDYWRLWRVPWQGRGFFCCKWSEYPAARYHQAQMSTSFQKRVRKPTYAALELHSNLKSVYLPLSQYTKKDLVYIMHVWENMCKNTHSQFYLPHEICVTTFPMSSNTFLGLISWFVELCPSCPYPPAPNVNTPPSCKISNTSCSDVSKDRSTARSTWKQQTPQGWERLRMNAGCNHASDFNPVTF